MARPEKIRLGEILVRQQMLTEAQLMAALDEQKRTGKKLGRVFIDSGYVKEDQISEALARQLNIPFINLKLYNLKPDLVHALPETQARRFRALVLEDRGSAYLVGMADPTDLFAYDELVRLLKRDIELAVVNEGELLQAVDRTYRRTGEITDLARVLEQELGEVNLDFGAMGGETTQEDAPVVKLLQTIFEDAVQVRASDIHIEPQETRLHVRFRIDGVLHLQTETDLKIATALALRLKLVSGLDISEKRLPQDGRFNIKIRNQTVDVRISTMPTQYGESVVMRLLTQGGGVLELERLGMPPAMLASFRQVIRRPHGLVVVTGPTGSGKTTTLYAALSEVNSPERKIITVEDPVEYRLKGINQVQVNEKIDLSFARVLRSALRQDPDVILVGEMRDQETAQIGMRAAMTGHLVFSTLHTNDAMSTPLRLVDMGVPRYMVATSLQAVLAQRLVRVVCENCSAPYTPQPHEIEWLRIDLADKAEQHEYRYGRGCNHCNGTGFQGRRGVYEMLEMNTELLDAINHHDPAHFIKVARKAMGNQTLRHHAMNLVLVGKTTIGEAMRISNMVDE